MCKILGHGSASSRLDVYRTVAEGEIKAERARYGPLGGRIHAVLPDKRIEPVKEQAGSPVCYAWQTCSDRTSKNDTESWQEKIKSSNTLSTQLSG